MALKKLLNFKPKAVKQWTLSKVQLKKITKDAGKVSKIQKIESPKLGLKVEELRILPERFLPNHLLIPDFWWPGFFCKPRYRVRKNQKNLTPIEWNRFIHAIEAIADSDMPTPTYQDFVQIHRQAMDTAAGHMWGAHGGVNFLTWHREYLAKLEARLMAINPLVTIPYWNWIEDRAIPSALNNSADFLRWGITRGGSFNGASIATSANHSALMALGNFSSFSTTLEAAPFHDRIHVLVGGTMVTSGSPADPLFWLHHAFIDKLFADWQVLHPAPAVNIHPNPNQVLQPPPIMTRKNSQVWNIHSLGYVYQ